MTSRAFGRHRLTLFVLLPLLGLPCRRMWVHGNTDPLCDLPILQQTKMEQLYTPGSVDWPVVRFAHISNSGGSSICRAAVNVSEAIKAKRKIRMCSNCNAPLRGPKRWAVWQGHVLSGRPRPSCRTLEAVAGLHGWPIVTSECMLEEVDPAAPVLCPQLRYFTVIRHPIVRIVNQLVYWPDLQTRVHRFARGETVIADTYNNATARRGKQGVVCIPRVFNRQACVFMMSNAFTRFFLGAGEHFASPWRELGREHLHKALAVLEQFVLVLPAEEMSAPAAHQLMAERLGWPAHLFNIGRYHSKNNEAARAGSLMATLERNQTLLDASLRPYSHYPGLRAAFDTTSMAMLEEMNELDMELYRWVLANWDRTVANFTPAVPAPV